MGRLDKAIDDIKKEFESAKKQTFVRDALAYALYQVWKKYDAKANDRYQQKEE